VQRETYNFIKEQYMLPEDDRVIETCRSVLNILMQILYFLNNIYIYVCVCVCVCVCAYVGVCNWIIYRMHSETIKREKPETQ